MADALSAPLPVDPHDPEARPATPLPRPPFRAKRIEEYGLIGNMHGAALVGRDGSIDWLCLPRFDSPACLAALLGDARNGRWLLAPAEAECRTMRRYVPDTAILETRFETPTGVCIVTDFMPVHDQSGEVALMRLVQGVSGQVDMAMELILRLGYGRVVPWVQRRPDGLVAIAGPDGLRLHTPVRLVGQDLTTQARFTIRAGAVVPFTLTWFASHRNEPGWRDPQRALAETEDWWHGWTQRCGADGPWGDALRRSLVTLKTLTYRPTGGIVAAPTTSLPEGIGGVRNWDYRYCWIRDATLTLYALLTAGYREEARAWREWLLRAAAGSPADLQIMYGLAGERTLLEYTLDWLPGYEGSRPVRVGNAAHSQLQLDIYGELLDALHVARKHRLENYEESWNLQKSLLTYLEAGWNQLDSGLWEMRGPRRAFTHSRIMCWAGFDRAVKAVEEYGLDGPVERWRELRALIHDDICRNGFNPQRNTFTQYYGGQTVDAALLLIPETGFLPPDDPRFIGTVKAIEEDLLVDGLVLRYRPDPAVEALPGDEGVFLACSFWLADAYLLMGRQTEAIALFEHLLMLRNDLGLFAEEYDPRLKRLVGNFPQAFSHIALINTALNLSAVHPPAKDRADGRAG